MANLELALRQRLWALQSRSVGCPYAMAVDMAAQINQMRMNLAMISQMGAM